MRSCREAALLLTRAQHDKLDFADRIGLRIHLLQCKRCRRFEQQQKLITQAMGRWRNYTDTDDSLIGD